MKSVSEDYLFIICTFAIRKKNYIKMQYTTYFTRTISDTRLKTNLIIGRKCTLCSFFMLDFKTK